MRLRTALRRLAMVGACTLICGSALAQNAPSPPDNPLSGSSLTRYRGRWGFGESDHDVYETIVLDYDAERRAGWSAHAMALGAYDLDGSDSSGVGVNDPFFSLQDTFDERFDARLYYGYVDVHNNDQLDVLRFGRQLIYATPLTLHFDGIRVESVRTGKFDLVAGAYAGVPVYPYESSSNGDVLVGVHAAAAPWEGGTLRVDWMHLEDETLIGNHVDNVWSTELRHVDIDDASTTDFETRFTGLEDEGRDLRVALSHHDFDRDLTLDLTYFELLNTQNELSVPLDPFTATLFELFPYYQVTALASKGWRDVFVSGGVDLRHVNDSGDVTQFNRDFERYFLHSTIADALPAGVSIGLLAEVWRSDGDEFETWGLDLERDLSDLSGVDGDLEASLGSYYSLFKYDLFAAEERDHVRTYYSYLRYRPDKSRSWSMRYELEDNELGTFHRLTLGVAWRF